MHCLPSFFLRRFLPKHGRNEEVSGQRTSETETAQQLSPTPSTPDGGPLDTIESHPHPTSSPPSPFPSDESIGRTFERGYDHYDGFIKRRPSEYRMTQGSAPHVSRQGKPFRPSWLRMISCNHLFPFRATIRNILRQSNELPTTASLLRPPTQSTVELQSYSENQDYLAQGKPEPSSRSQTLVYRLGDYEWWIKVTFVGTVSSVLDVPAKQTWSKRERREEYQGFVKLIQYNSLPLLDDTVTEVILEIAPGTVDLVRMKHTANDVNRYTKLARNLTCIIREDPSRVIYPLCDEFPSFRNVHVADLLDSEEITDGVFRVSHKHDGMHYIYKVVNRPLYHPRDTDVIRCELKNLEYFKGVPNIVQQAGIVVSPNPYMTSRRCDQPPVLSGILLRYYCGGSLQNILSKNQAALYPWKRWGIQIATALSFFHAAGRTHMDIKPSNVVLDAEGNAVLIDISGIGGVTHVWRAPEIRDELSPIELPFERRRWNDIWAYGKLLSEIAAHAEDSPYSVTLKSIAVRLMEEDTQIRMTLSEAISQLEAGECNCLWS